MSSEVLEYNPFAPPTDPYPLYRTLRREHPVHRITSDAFDFWTLSRFEDVQGVARDWRTFTHVHGVDPDGSDRLMFKRGDFLQQDPPRHDVLRKIVAARFSPRSIGALEPRVRAVTESLVADMRARGAADILSDFARPLPFIIVSEMLGLPAADRAQLEQWTAEILYREPGRADIPQSALDTALTVRSYLRDRAAERRRQPRDDLLTQIVQAQSAGVLDDDEVVGLSFLLFAAGSATTYGLISNAVLALDRYPDERAELVADPSQMPAAIEEILRWESPLQQSVRTTTREVELHGTTIPEGARVLVLFGSANRDERRWERPDDLDIDRPAKRHLAFGEGIHHCLGAPLARLEARVALDVFLAAFPAYEVVEVGEPVSLQTHRTRTRIEVRL